MFLRSLLPLCLVAPLLVACSGGSGTTTTSGPNATGMGSGTIAGERGFPVRWAGAILPKADGGAVTSIAVLADEASFTCTPSSLEGTLPARYLVIGTTERVTGAFPVGDEGPGRIGYVSVMARGADGGSDSVAVATAGSVTVTIANDARLAGSFEVTLLARDTGTTSTLSGSFDAPFCSHNK